MAYRPYLIRLLGSDSLMMRYLDPMGKLQELRSQMIRVSVEEPRFV